MVVIGSVLPGSGRDGDSSKPPQKLNSGCLHSLQECRKGIQGLAFVDWFERLGQLRETERTKKMPELAEMAGNKEQMEKFRSPMKPENLRKGLVELRGLHRRAETAHGKPWKEADTEVTAIEKDVQASDSYLVKSLWSVVRNMLDKRAELATRQTMLDLVLQQASAARGKPR